MITSRMSQLLTEALQEMRWAEEQLEAAAGVVVGRNGSQHLPPTLGQPKLSWLPAEVAKPAKPAKPARVSAPAPPLAPLDVAKPAKHAQPANASAPAPPWAPAELLLHWPSTRDAVTARGGGAAASARVRRRGLPAQPERPPRARRLLQLYAFGGEDESSAPLKPPYVPQQLAGLPELATVYSDSFKEHARSRANHTDGQLASVTTCADALALWVTVTALVTCLLTLTLHRLFKRYWRSAVPAKQTAEPPPAGDAAGAARAPATDKV